MCDKNLEEFIGEDAYKFYMYELETQKNTYEQKELEPLALSDMMATKRSRSMSYGFHS